MTQSISIDNSCLSYQFFFLMRRYWLEDDDLTQEPFVESDWIKINQPEGKEKGKGVQIDNDKRLFRYDVNPTTPLEEWETHLMLAWHNLKSVYHQAFDAQKIKIDSDVFCQKMLLGVGLLIWDKNLTQRQVEIDLQLGQQLQKGIFDCRQSEVWFQIQDHQKTMPTPATLHPFELPNHFKQYNVALQLQGEKPFLIERSNNSGSISFSVLGILHSDDTDATHEGQWAVELNRLLLGGGNYTHRKLEIMNVMIARLLINQSVFQMLDYECISLRHKLQKTAGYYNNFDNKTLKNLPYRKLHDGVSELDKLINRSKHQQARIIQAKETLAINHDNFQHRLSNLTQDHPTWDIQWNFEHKYDKYPPLLNKINNNINILQSHATYIGGKLVDVMGAKEYWQSYIKESSHALLESLGHIGHFIVFLVALAEMGNVLKHFSHGEESHAQPSTIWFLEYWQYYEHFITTYILQNKHVYTIIFSWIIGYIIWAHIFKPLWKWVRFHLNKGAKKHE